MQMKILSIYHLKLFVTAISLFGGRTESKSSLAFVTPYHHGQHSSSSPSVKSPFIIAPSSSLCTSPTTLYENKSSDGDEQTKEGGGEDEIKIPSTITNKVLQQVYPSLIIHNKQYGNPNIPLGTSDGKKCKTLRRLYAEGKLKEEEIELLNALEFRWSSLEDIYEEADFEECLGRLVEYEKENKNNYQIPKKYPSDPELGAWVTMIRRIGRDNLPLDRRTKLDNINFAWKSTRKCGSSFMTHYRSIKEKIAEADDDDVAKEVVGLLNEEDKKWINAQRLVYEKGNLSDARVKYMNQLVGLNWREPLL